MSYNLFVGICIAYAIDCYTSTRQMGKSRERHTMAAKVSQEDHIQQLKTIRLRQLEHQLEEMVGLANVKKKVNEITAYAKILKSSSVQVGHQSLHMRFLGNPGTGKTVVARIVGEMLLALGAISTTEEDNTSDILKYWHKRVCSSEDVEKDGACEGYVDVADAAEFPFIEAGRADLVADKKGQTAPKVRKAVESAFGGVLFIDEAYALVSEGKDVFGREAVDELIKQMDDNRKYVVVIMAGYSQEMAKLLQANPGLKSRVPTDVTFSDYTCQQLLEIGRHQMKAKGLSGDDNVFSWLSNAFQVVTGCSNGQQSSQERSNGNGRSVRNILEASIRAMASRVMASDTRPNPDHKMEPDDFQLDASTPEICKGDDDRKRLCILIELQVEDVLEALELYVQREIYAQCKAASETYAGGTAALKSLESKQPAPWKEFSEKVKIIARQSRDAVANIKSHCRDLNTILSPATALLQERHGHITTEAASTDPPPIYSATEKFWLKATKKGFGKCWLEYGKLNGGRWIQPSQHREEGKFTLDECEQQCLKKKSSCPGFSVNIVKGTCTTLSEKTTIKDSSGSEDVVQQVQFVNVKGTVKSIEYRCYTLVPDSITQDFKKRVERVITTNVKLVKGLVKEEIQKETERQKRQQWRRERQEHPELQPQISISKHVERAQQRVKQLVATDPATEPVENQGKIAAVKKEGEVVKGPLQQLDRMIGLKKVKEAVYSLRDTLDFANLRATHVPTADSIKGQSFHMAFLGNPGTGKTVVARIVAEILTKLGAIKKKIESESEDTGARNKKKKGIKIREVSSADLIAGIVGGTALKVKENVQKAFGTVLLIDEAYALNPKSNAFGQEAVDTLIKEIEDHRTEMIAIFAGYEKEMEDFFDANPGFDSRVPYKIYFDDYTCTELAEIADAVLRDDDYSLGSDGHAQKWLQRTVEIKTGCCESIDECKDTRRRDNGNGRAVRNLLEAAQREMSSRVVATFEKQAFFQTAVREFEDKKKELKELLDKERKDMENKLYYQKEKITSELKKKKIEIQEQFEVQLSKIEDCTAARSAVQEITSSDMRTVLINHLTETLQKLCAEKGLEPKIAHQLQSETITDEAWKPLKHSFSSDGSCDYVENLEDPPIPSTPTRAEELFRQMGENEELKNVHAELDKLIGLGTIKQAMGQLYATSLFRSRRGLFGFDAQTQSFHMAFLGNPGTGKTHVAKIVGEMLVKLGLINKGDSKKTDDERASKKKDDGGVHMVTRADLVAGYLGQTAPLVVKHVGESIGGVMFVDEAYALVRSDTDDFGQSAVDTLIKEMEDKRDKVVVILAGYEQEMETFFKSNPGFKSRVPLKYIFPDYTCDELVSVHDLFLSSTNLKWDETTKSEADENLKNLIRVMTGCCNSGDPGCHPNPNSGNARAVRNIFEAIIQKFAVRVAGPDVDVDALSPEAKKLSNPDVTAVIQDEADGLKTLVCDGSFAEIAKQQSLISKAFVGNKKNSVEDFQRSIRLVISSQKYFLNVGGIQDGMNKCMVALVTATKKILFSLNSYCQEDGVLQKQIDILEGHTVQSGLTFVEQFDDAMVKIIQAVQEISLLGDLVDEELSQERLPEPDQKLFESVYTASQTCKQKVHDVKERTVRAPVDSMMKFSDSFGDF